MAAPRHAATQIVEEFGSIDIIFANADVEGFKPLLEMKYVYWCSIFMVRAPGIREAHGAKRCRKLLLKRDHG